MLTEPKLKSSARAMPTLEVVKRRLNSIVTTKVDVKTGVIVESDSDDTPAIVQDFRWRNDLRVEEFDVPDLQWTNHYDDITKTG